MVDPLTADDELRGALGGGGTHEIGFVAAARLFILMDILADLRLDDESMAGLLGEARPAVLCRRFRAARSLSFVVKMIRFSGRGRGA